MALWLAIPSDAQVRLSALYGDHMIMQRDRPVIFGGWASPGERISVRFNGVTTKTTADKSGKWSVKFAPIGAGGSYEAAITGRNAIVIKDIVGGDVWVCSGQSNMEWPVRLARDADTEMAQARFPLIRQFLVAKQVSGRPLEEVKPANWESATPDKVGDFTAVGYFFAREVHRRTGVPIGLINTSWGGTHAETWTSPAGFQADPDLAYLATATAVDLDKMVREKEAQVVQKLSSLGLGTKAEARGWETAAFNDTAWPTLLVPGAWESTLGEVDGVLWFRFRFTVPATDVGKPAVIHLGKIDDTDETYLNGVRIGGMNAWDAERQYAIQGGSLQAGENVLAVRVTDTGGGGGFWSEPTALAVKIAAGPTLSLAGPWRFQVESVQTTGVLGPNMYPSLLYNAMLYPLRNVQVKGFLWYQGESNAGRAYQYRKTFPAMIRDWRRTFGQGDLPFYFVQLASFDADHGTSSSGGSTWAELREAQQLTLSLPNTGMAVTTDIGEPRDIHPRNKQDVGLRLALLALNKDYGLPVTCSGPVFRSMALKGTQVQVDFDHATGLIARDKYGYVRGFEIAGEDKIWHYAQAVVRDGHVWVSSELVTAPVAVRYNWADNAEEGNLFNAAGLPAAPFRTDSWPGKTDGQRAQF